MFAFPACSLLAWIGFFPDDIRSSVCLLAYFDWWSVCSENISVCLLSSSVYANSAVSAAAQLCMFTLCKKSCFCSWSKWSFNGKSYFYCFQKWSFNEKLYFTAFEWGHSTAVGADIKKMHPSSHIAASLFQVTYIWSCLLFAIKQKLILPHQFLNQAPPRPLLGLVLVS